MPLRHIFLHNFWLKLLSLGLGSLIWLGVHYQIQLDYPLSQPQPSRTVLRQTVTLPISIICRPGENRAVKITPQEATITVHGEEAVLRKLSKKDLIVYVEVPEFRSQKSMSEALGAHAPVDVLVSDISPKSVTIEPISP